MQLLLIDPLVPDAQIFVDSVNENTTAIIYSPDTIFPTGPIDRIGVVSIPGGTKIFGANISNDSIFIQEHAIQKIDFLESNTLNNSVTSNYYDLLRGATGVIIGASNNHTGNVKYGGDWIMENTNEDIEQVYFTENIKNYKHLLSLPQFAFSFLIDSNGVLLGCGENSYGQLGLPPCISINSWFTIPNIPRVKAFSCGSNHSLILLEDGRVMGAGDNTYKQLGPNGNESNGDKSNGNESNGFFFVGITANSIACGINFSLILTTDGQVIFMGDCYYITGLETASPVLPSGPETASPVVPSGPGSDNVVPTDGFYRIPGIIAKAMSCGPTHSLLLLPNGSVMGAGDNTYGQLGLLDVTSQITFTLIPDMVAKAISCGMHHSMILLPDESVMGAGDNTYGQLGLLDVTSQPTFTIIPDIYAKALSCGIHHSIILLTDGSVMGSGYNSFGQLGLQDMNMTQTTFTLIPDIVATTVVCGPYRSFLLTTTGELMGAGDNRYTQLGLSNIPSLTDSTFGILYTNVSSIYAAPLETYIVPIIDSNFNLYIIGNAEYGQSGRDNDKTYITDLTTNTPQVISVGTTRKGMVYIQGEDTSGYLLYYTGTNQYGELGDTTLSTDIPLINELLYNIISFSCGLDHSLFIDSTNQVYSSGLNSHGQLGKENVLSSFIPIRLNITGTQCATGEGHSAVIDSNGDLYMFGQNNYGQLGNNSIINEPLPILIKSNVKRVACGSNHTLVLANDFVYSFGNNKAGQLGFDSPTPLIPTVIPGITNIAYISAGGDRSAALDFVGNLWIWGYGCSTPKIFKTQVTDVTVTLMGIFYVYKKKYYCLDCPILVNGPLISQDTQIVRIQSNICFPANTPVHTDQGDIMIQTLVPGLHTIRSKPIVAITETYSSEPELIVLEKDSLFTHCPSNRTVITKEHKIFYKGVMTEAYKFLNTQDTQEGIYTIPYSGEPLYNVLLEEHGIMKINNMIVETLDPSNTIGKIFKKYQEELNKN